MRIRWPAALSVAVACALLAGPALQAEPPCAVPAPLSFEEPVYIDTERAGGEPVSVVANDGSIVVAAHRGTTHLHPYTVPEPLWYAGYAPQTYLWRSADGGDTWDRIEILPGVSMHSVTSQGFSDPDLSRDDAGNLYGAEGHGEPVSVFTSTDDGASWPNAQLVAGHGDRPWLAARGNGRVYLVAGWGGASLYRSEDGGVTWSAGEWLPGSIYGKIHVDPTDPHGLYIPANLGVNVSRDDGRTWAMYPLGDYPERAQMNSIGVDREGWVYTAVASRTGVRLSAWNPETRAWGQAHDIPRIGSGTPLWPWVVAGDAGRVAVAWYELDRLDPGVPSLRDRYAVRVYVAVTHDARATAASCGGAAFAVADAVGRPIHEGAEPCFALACAVRQLADRRLGDFFTVNFDLEGRVFVATGDTMLKGPGGTELQTSRPLFARADDASPRLLD